MNAAAPQIIRSPSGEEMVVIPRTEYEALLSGRAGADEDAADVAAFDEAMAELAAAGQRPADAALPEPVSRRILAGDSRLTAWRRHRGLTQAQLSVAAEIAQGYLSQIETGDRTGAPDKIEKLAAALDVPVDWIA